MNKFITQAKEPSAIQLRAQAVARCIEALEREGHAVEGIHISAKEAIVLLSTAHLNRKPYARETTIINTPKGRFMMMEVNIYGVHVRWKRPFFIQEVKPSLRIQ